MARFYSQAMRSCSAESAPQLGDGLPLGTIIHTLDGALPIEFLSPGDRVITRAGARVLRSVETGTDGFLLGFDTPQVIYADGREMLAA